MADTDGQCVGCIERGESSFREVENSAYHGMDLVLTGMTVAAGGLLDLSGGILEYRDTLHSGGKQDDALGLSELEGCLGVQGMKGGLYGNLCRTVLAEDLCQSVKDLFKPPCTVIRTGPYGPVTDMDQARRL